MKKTSYPNRGHLVPDYYVDDISRAYIDGANILLVLESPTGIETQTEILKNEAVRLTIPAHSIKKFSQNLTKAADLLIGEKQEIPAKETEPSQVESDALGSAFEVGD